MEYNKLLSNVNHIGDVNDLTTTDKNSIVGAINELNEKSGNVQVDMKASSITFDNTTNGMSAPNVQLAIEEVFQSGVNVKNSMVQAINSKKTVPDITNSDSWGVITQRINDIKEGSGNATIGDVLVGKTFTNNDGIEYTGTLNIGGTASTSDVLAGRTFTDDSKTIKTGTMVNRGGAQTVTPGTSVKTLSAGYYSGNITVAGDANLVAGNIISGKSIFGVAGTATIASLGGRRYTKLIIKATSSTKEFSMNSLVLGKVKANYLIISGLSFTPSFIFCTGTDNAGYVFFQKEYNYFKGNGTPMVVFGTYPSTWANYDTYNIVVDSVVLSGSTYNIPVANDGTYACYIFE